MSFSYSVMACVRNSYAMTSIAHMLAHSAHCRNSRSASSGWERRARAVQVSCTNLKSRFTLRATSSSPCTAVPLAVMLHIRRSVENTRGGSRCRMRSDLRPPWPNCLRTITYIPNRFSGSSLWRRWTVDAKRICSSSNSCTSKSASDSSSSSDSSGATNSMNFLTSSTSLMRVLFARAFCTKSMATRLRRWGGRWLSSRG
mmetsp:Transcript_10081/g.25201  ORF Transcript_10081/g.25201 Transcript_10081/m.25201 type:complete len:200 (+) Transcript_10081:560-1159(+)